MRLFTGLAATAYQDVLWALGVMIDEHQIHDIRLWEHENGLLLQGRRAEEGGHGGFHTVLFTDEQLRELVASTFERGAQSTPRPANGE
jgi:hypothetical protein